MQTEPASPKNGASWSCTTTHLCRRFIFITGAAEDPKYRAFLSQVKSANLLEELRRLLEAQL